jgi:asparagine synthase (glutamine-hydrolysing)
MCGIVGIATKNGAVNLDMLDAATRSLAHRGPDDAGTIILRDGSDEIGLGNRRLAILDLSPLGHQPMQDSQTGNWIVYNGEIFNFVELRSDLEKAGVEFCSQSDTEVLLKAYGAWGEKCLLRLRGMFAFAIWDARKHRLFLARDQMGIKPLYYAQSGQHFLFASEVRTLLGTGLVPRRLDQAGLQNFLTFGSLYDPITLIESISALRPGHFLTWERGRLQETQYWDLVDPANDSSERRSKTDLKVEINEAVRRQIVSDVPVGVFLSGGIDSSALVAILAQNGIKPETFSIVFGEAEYNEATFSRRIAQAFKTNHHEILVSQRDALERMPAALSAMDLPTIDGVNTYIVSEQTRAAGVKVALSGLGGDELFAGYSTFADVRRMEHFLRLWRHVPAKSTVAKAFSLSAPNNDQNRKLLTLLRRDDRALHPYFLARMLFTPTVCNALMKSMSQEASDRAESEIREYSRRVKDLDEINAISYLECRCYMLNTLLRDADGMSMANGLEIRVPLIDEQLAARILAIAGSEKISGHVPKPLLLAALDSPLPDEIVHRPKQGFTLPFERWLRGDMREDVERSLHHIADGPLAGAINASAAQQVWQDFCGRRTSWSRPWGLYVLQKWCERHDVTV